MQTELIPFHQHSLITVKHEGRVLVAMKPICESIGLNWRAQYNRLKRDSVLSTCVVIMTTQMPTCVAIMATQMPGDDQSREVTFLDLEYLNGWLFGIDANRVKPELRETVIDYQKHCYHVLFQHFHGKPAIQHEKYWFAKNPHWQAIRELALHGLANKTIAVHLSLSAGRVSRAIRRMIEVGLIDPAKRIAARFKAETAKRMMQLALCLNWGVRADPEKLAA